MGTYEALGLRPVINASATLTRLGGSRMPEPVLAAMLDAARAFVDLHELQRAVGERIAELTGNEACYVTSGAAAGIMLAVCACVAGGEPERLALFPDLTDLPRREVIVLRSQRNGYDFAARQTGARLVEIGGTAADLEAALSERTACVLWFAGAHYADGAPPLEQVVALAQAQGVPVVVDAAAQIPPIASLWRFTREIGADLAIFSGGKGLRGPQASGLLLGRGDLIEAARAAGSPNHGIGRPLKVGKEELAGLLAAVEWSLAQDEPTLLARYETVVQGWLAGLAGLPGVTAERGYPSEAGQPHPRAIVRVGPPCPWRRDALADALWAGEPRIAVAPLDADGLALNPQTLEPGEEDVVLAALRRLLTVGSAASP